ncbi:MAG: hypothetical protein V4510_02430 [bacterium]
MAYTVHDTPALVARVETDLAAAVRIVRAGDPALRSLVLTGAFARGEGAVLDGQPQNDYDLVALRGIGPARVSYRRMRLTLEDRLRMHVDLAPVGVARLRFVSRSIFWYETRARGRVLWGDNLLGRIRVRTPSQLDRREGLRLLVNRAAGLLIAAEEGHPHDLQIQSSKALLAALDAHLLALGRFAPSQTERWAIYNGLVADGAAPAALVPFGDALRWAYVRKVDPAQARIADPWAAWRSARAAVLDAVPAALRHAGLPTLDAYGRRDGLAERLWYMWRAPLVPGAHRMAPHPTGQIRVATLKLLRAARDGKIPAAEAHKLLREVAAPGARPIRTLEALRHATLQ